MSGDSANYNVGYPIYGAKFINEDTLLVAGGGGQFNPSFPNKITALKVNFQKKKHIRRFREITLDSIDDAPTSLDCNNNLILVGCNELYNQSSADDVNHHLRKFMYEQEHLKFVASIDFNRTTDPSVFTKFIYINQRATVAAIASSEVPTVIRIIDPRNLTENYEIVTGKEVKDLHFAPNGILLSYITSNSLEVASVRDGKFVARKIDFDKNLILSNIRFLSDNTLLVAASLSNSDGVCLLKLGVSFKGVKILKTASFMFDLNGITSMDVSPNKKCVGLSSNDNSIAIISVENLKLMKLVPKVHESTITKITFSPDSKYLASTSMGNTINVLKLSNKTSSFLRRIWSIFVNFVLLVVLAGAIQLCYRYNVHGFLYKYAHDMYMSKFKKKIHIDQESSSYFTINNDIKGITVTADIISTVDLTSDIDTEHSSFDTTTMKTIMEDEPTSVWISPSSVLQSTSVDAPTPIFSSLSSFDASSSDASESVTSEPSLTSWAFHESSINEPILSSSASAVTESVTSSPEPIIFEQSFSPSETETVSPSLEPITKSAEPPLSFDEPTVSSVVEQAEELKTTSSDTGSEITNGKYTSSSATTTVTADTTTAVLSTTTIITTQIGSIDDSVKLSNTDYPKPASTREIYKTKIITEVITKIEYRNIPVSISQTTAEQYTKIKITSSKALTPTDTMVSGPLTTIDPIASELEGMVETPTDPTSMRSEIDSVKANFIPTESASSMVGSEIDSVKANLIPTEPASSIVGLEIDSVKVNLIPTEPASLTAGSESPIAPHQAPYSESSIISSSLSLEVPIATSSFFSQPTSLVSISTDSESHSFSNSASSTIEEIATPLSGTETDTATSTDNSGYTYAVTETIQSSDSQAVPFFSSESTTIGKTPSVSVTSSSGNPDSISIQPFKTERQLFEEVESSVVSQTVSQIIIPATPSASDEVAATPAATSGLIQKEIMIQVKASTNSSEASSILNSLLSTSTQKANAPVFQMPTAEAYSFSYEEADNSTLASGGVVLSSKVEFSSLFDANIPSQPTAIPLDTNLDSEIVNRNIEQTTDNVDLHDEL